jgi:hypothetical protein
VQLLNSWALNIVVTTLVVCGFVAFFTGLIAHRLRVASAAKPSFTALFFAAFAFSLLGFVTGELMGDSREGVVGTVIPAALTLLGGMAAYIVTSKGIREQAATSGILICFTFCLLIGSTFGIRLRVEYDMALQAPALLGARDVALEKNRLAVDLQRLEDFITFTQLRDEFAKSNKMDLSGFKSALESPPPAAEAPTAPNGSSSR